VTGEPEWATPRPEQIPPYCRACRRALSIRLSPAGVLNFIHHAEQRGEAVDHQAQPVPITEITDPIIDCDFCSAPDAAWVYTCADQTSDLRIVTSSTVKGSEYRDRHHAARTRNVRTSAGPMQLWGERWTACDGCAALVEARDLMGLIARVTDAMPAKYTRGKKLARVRGELHQNYSTVLATLRPGRGRITSDNPLGQWEPSAGDQPPGLPATASDPAESGPTAEPST
jgi:hypothetical protein